MQALLCERRAGGGKGGKLSTVCVWILETSLVGDEIGGRTSYMQGMQFLL